MVGDRVMEEDHLLSDYPTIKDTKEVFFQSKIAAENIQKFGGKGVGLRKSMNV